MGEIRETPTPNPQGYVAVINIFEGKKQLLFLGCNAAAVHRIYSTILPQATP